MKRFYVSIFVGGAFLILGACSDTRGPFERAGERSDEIIDNIGEGEPPLKRKGTAERMGESIDRTVDDAQDALNDARR